MHYAGSDSNAQFNAILHAAGVEDRLESFYLLGARPPSAFPRHLLDSGGFSARTRGVAIDVHQYADYINRHAVRYAFNLDTSDPEETQRHQRILEAECPDTLVLPIYHLSDWEDPELRGLLDQFIDEGHTYIGVGGVAGEGSPLVLQHNLYRHVFRRTGTHVRVHGLGITSRDLLLRYPWRSVDSTSWTAPGRYGSSHRDARLRAFENKTYDWQYRVAAKVEETVQLTELVTRVWASRGVVWED